MSTSSSQPLTSSSLTRQQLDELDALLQRMLELPAHSAEENAFPNPATAGQTLGVLEEDPVAVEPPSISLANSPFILRNHSALPLLPAPETREVTAEWRDSLREAISPEPALWLWPLVWGNQVFDHCAGRLGRAGRWLQRPAGRALLGWTGLVCLAAAVALLVYDWIRWNW
jgi:hypothetical protein